MSRFDEIVRGDPRGDADLVHAVALTNLRQRLFGAGRRNRLGRYEIRSVIGMGGMGVVYRAHDPDLARDVAVKVIRGDGDSLGAARLAREARALATLVHENILPIYDVGVCSGPDAKRLGLGDLFVVTELVDGESLATWLEREQRDLAEIRRVFAAAARGLTAAHAAGFVHRDFKPGNVLIGRDGRVRVCDFGLVATVDEGRSTAQPVDHAVSGDESWDQRLSRTDAWLGTPGYIAPECFRGHPPDPRSDQYAFCVSLWEALYEAHPFLDQAMELDLDLDLDLDREASGRALRAPPPGRLVPRELHAALVRGLAHDPDDRWASMDPIIDALEGRRTRRIAPLVAAAAAVVAVPAVTLLQADEPCSGDAQLTRVWNDARRASVGDAIQATEASFAADATTRVAEQIDAYAEAWASGYASTCADIRRGAWDSEQQQARLRCFQRRLGDLDATLDALEAATLPTLGAAVSSALELPAPSSCETEATDHGWTPRDAHDEAVVADAARQIAASNALRRAHQAEAAIEAARAALSTAAALPDAPVATQARIALGHALAVAARYEESAAELETAYFTAFSTGNEADALEAAVRRLDVARHDRRLEDGRVWAEHGRALLRGAATDDERSAIDRELGHLEVMMGDHAKGIALLEQAFELAKATTGDDSASTSDAAGLLADAYRDAGRFEEALELERLVLRSTVERLGPSHPLAGQAHSEIGGTYAQQRRLDEAEAELEEAIAIQESVGEPLALAHTLSRLAFVYGRKREDERGHALLERVLAIRLKALGPDHPLVVTTQLNLGTNASKQGRLDEAEQLLSAAIESGVALFGADDPRVANGYYNLAFVYIKRGDNDRAVASLRSAAQSLEAARGPEARELADLYRMLSLRVPDADEALGFARRAVAIAQQREQDDLVRALTHAALSRALRLAGGQDAEAAREAELARATCPTDWCRQEIEANMADGPR